MYNHALTDLDLTRAFCFDGLKQDAAGPPGGAHTNAATMAGHMHTIHAYDSSRAARVLLVPDYQVQGP